MLHSNYGGRVPIRLGIGVRIDYGKARVLTWVLGQGGHDYSLESKKDMVEEISTI